MKKQNKFQDFIGGLYSSLKSQFTKEKLLAYLEQKALKALFKKFLISGGLKGWVIRFTLGYLIDEADEHLIEPALRKINLLRDKADGSKQFGRIQNAQDRDDWRDSVRNR